jgi:tRNA threonylcarbamoyladenosine biosynthesis protein TsaE
MMNSMSYELKSEEDTKSFGRQLANHLAPGLVIGLQGEIGRGKTCMVRACLEALGVTSLIKSPTFTLVETYDIKGLHIHHFDLYRLQSEYELEDLGFRDYLHSQSICFIEWPEKSPNLLPFLDLSLEFKLKLPGRMLTIQAKSEKGKQVLQACQRELCID